VLEKSIKQLNKVSIWVSLGLGLVFIYYKKIVHEVQIQKMTSNMKHLTHHTSGSTNRVNGIGNISLS